MTGFELLFYLLVGHALADFSLQTDVMAKGKNRNRMIDPDMLPPGQQHMPCWPYWLSAHALIHGGMVALITGIWQLGLIETVVHWIIDFTKCDNRISVHEDQILHFCCKLIYVGAISIYA